DLNPCEIVSAGPNPGVSVTAQDLAKEFAADRQAARKKYDDKWAVVTGEVIARTKSDLCAVVLTVKGDGDITLACCFGEAYKRTTEGVKVGSQVELFGKLQVSSEPKEKVIGLNYCLVSEAK